jgi:hypothetical protein
MQAYWSWMKGPTYTGLLVMNERFNLYRLTGHELRARYHSRERNHKLLRERPFSYFLEERGLWFFR